MKLLGLGYENLFSLGKGSIDLEPLGLTLVTGFSEDEGSSNGAGKSSLANKAILWTLFGETAGGLRADAVVNRHGKKSCKGRVLFENTDGTKYAIERRRPAKLSLFKGTTDISAHTAKETQTLIDSLLGFDFDTFVQTSVFGQGRHAHYPSLSPKQRKEVLENILPMEQADEWAAFTDKAIKKLTPELALSAADVVASESNLSTLVRVLQQSEADGEAFETSREYRIMAARDELEGIKASFQIELDGISVVESKLLGFSLSAATDKMEVMRLEAGTWEQYKIEADTKKLEASTSLSQWKRKLNDLTHEKDTLMGATACVTCKRVYDSDSAALAMDRMQEILEEQAEALAASKAGNAAHDYYYGEKRKWELQIDRAAAMAAIIEVQINEYHGLERARELAQAKIATASAGAQARLDVAKNETNPHVAVYERHNAEMEGAQQLLNNANIANTQLSKELDHLKYWKEVYGKDLKLKMFEDACPFLDSRTQYHLGRLGNSQIHCDFSTIKRLATGATKEEFDVVVWSETGGRGFEALSGGEQQMVSFAIGLSLADLASRVGGAESGFLILDEPFTELDERNGQAVIEYLQAEVEGGKDTVLLISNEESLKGLIQNRIHVVKKGGISNVRS